MATITDVGLFYIICMYKHVFGAPVKPPKSLLWITCTRINLDCQLTEKIPLWAYTCTCTWHDWYIRFSWEGKTQLREGLKLLYSNYWYMHTTTQHIQSFICQCLPGAWEMRRCRGSSGRRHSGMSIWLGSQWLTTAALLCHTVKCLLFTVCLHGVQLYGVYVMVWYNYTYTWRQNVLCVCVCVCVWLSYSTS